jgi:hypothetical protein
VGICGEKKLVIVTPLVGAVTGKAFAKVSVVKDVTGHSSYAGQNCHGGK